MFVKLAGPENKAMEGHNAKLPEVRADDAYVGAESDHVFLLAGQDGRRTSTEDGIRYMSGRGYTSSR